MYTVSFIAILGILCMYACYRPLCACYKDFYTGNKNGRSVVVEERDKHAGFMLFLVIFAVALLTRFIAAVMYKGYETDMNCFISWSDMVFNGGFSEFYKSESFTDYPPGYMYILYVIGAIRSLFGMAYDSAATRLLVKLPAIIADMGAGWLIYRVASRHTKEIGAAVISAVYLFCPAVILDSAVWGQTDAVFTFFVALVC